MMLDEKAIEQAVLILQKGGLVAMPTETVYGLAADARQEAAVRKIFQAKGRPADHPLIVHLAEASQMDEWAMAISEEAWTLAKHFWPGPLTMILRKKEGISSLITGGQDTIGLRVPHHPVAHALLKKIGGGLAAPSANRFGRISPTSAEAVREELGDKVDLILEGGACDIGVESTIVDVSGDEVVVLRPGMISTTEIENVLKKKISQRKKNSPRVSGSLESHYAPMTPLIVLPSERISLFLQEKKGKSMAVMLLKKMPVREFVFYKEMPNDAKNYAHDLYQTLRELDKKGFDYIVMEAVPTDSEWDAVRDRIERASIKY